MKTVIRHQVSVETGWTRVEHAERRSPRTNSLWFADGSPSTQSAEEQRADS